MGVADVTEAEVEAVVRFVVESLDVRVDWSDTWSDEDLRDFLVASLRRLDASEED